MKWRAEHFNGVDWDNRERKNAIYKLINDPGALLKPFKQPQRPHVRRTNSIPQLPSRRLSTLLRRFSAGSETRLEQDDKPAQRPGKGWAEDVDMEHGNNDFLMFSNIDFTHPEVRRELMEWGEWMINIRVQGFRVDAVQHFSFAYTKDWIQHVNQAFHRHSGGSKDVFVVGEVWSGDLSRITAWLDAVQHSSGHPQVFAFDAPLLYNFSRISEDLRRRSRNLDLRTILRESLAKNRPKAAVTLVTNHDTQPGQTCYTPMPRQLKLLWYAFILLRKHGLPCVFWGDLFGTNGPHAEAAVGVDNGHDRGGKLLTRSRLAKLILCRKYFAHGEQTDYFESPLTIGWTRNGRSGEDNGGCAMILNVDTSTSKQATKRMRVGRPGQIWIDALGQVDSQITIDAAGTAPFPSHGIGVSVFVKQGSKDSLNLAHLHIDHCDD